MNKLNAKIIVDKYNKKLIDVQRIKYDIICLDQKFILD